jgi:hypothetical protein
MVRTLALVFLAIVAFALVATPGLGGAALLVVPVAVLVVVWWIALGAATHGHRSEALVRIRHRQFLGPGGPDDPFAGEPVNDRDRFD